MVSNLLYRSASVILTLLKVKRGSWFESEGTRCGGRETSELTRVSWAAGSNSLQGCPGVLEGHFEQQSSSSLLCTAAELGLDPFRAPSAIASSISCSFGAGRALGG